MTNRNEVKPLQGLAAHLRCEARALGVLSHSRKVLIDWATEVEAAQSRSATSDAAKHWHDLFVRECQEHKDHAARLGAEIEALEAGVAAGGSQNG